MNVQPPKWADRFLRWYCDPDLLEEIQGDSQELFYRRVEEEGVATAKRKYIWDVIRFFRLSNIRSNKLKINSLIMFNSYLKIGFRNITKNWGISFINIFGLSLAVGCAITFFMFLDVQYDMDSYHTKKDQIFTLVNHVKNDGGTEIWAQNPFLVAKDLQEKHSIVENTMRMEYERANMRQGDKVFSELISYTDPAFFEMFDYELDQGIRDVLNEKQNMVISSTIAEKYFGDTDPMGKTVTLKFPGERSQSFVIGGVLSKFKANASFSFDIIVPMENYYDLNKAEKITYSKLTNAVFIQLEKGHLPNELTEQMDEYVALHNEKASDWTIEKFEFIPLVDMALRDFEVHGSVSGGGHPAGRIAMAVIGVTLLLLACFNYMNISIASATRRLKEIALRKVMGGARKQIIHQFLTENLILCLFSMLLGTLLCYYFFLPGFNMVLPIEIPFTFSSFKVAVLFFGGLLLLIGFASGSYPAFYISRFQPVSIFRGSPNLSGKGLFSKILLSLQLILACMTVVACIIFSDNAMHMNEKDWGYDPSGIFAVRINSETQYTTLLRAAESNPRVKSYSASKGHIGKYDMVTTASQLDKQIKTFKYVCAPGYLETMNLRLVDGQLFDPFESVAESNQTVVTSLFVEKMGWKNPIEQVFTVDSTDYQVIGVVEKFYTRNFHGQEAAYFVLGHKDNFNFFVFNVGEDAIFDIDDEVHEAWFEASPNDPYDRSFQMFSFDSFYQENDANIYILLSISVFAVILGCLGLFGLLSFNLQRRMKEFGVRKVLGADRGSLITLANKEYLWVMLASLLTGAPIGFLMMNTLLPIVYAEPKEITALPFLLSAGIMVFTVGITVTGQILRATKANPSEVLRSE